MKINGDLHTHTQYSHGKSTVEENVKSALAKGLKRIAITDHGSGHVFYGVKKNRWMELKEEIARVQEMYPQIRIDFGVEANIISMDGTIDVEESMLSLFDVVNVGYHYGVGIHKVSDLFGFYLLNALAKILPLLVKPARSANTRALVRAMEKYSIHMITHPGAKVPVDIGVIARKAAEKKVILEINAHHGHLTVEELKVAMKEPVHFAINSDAHHQEHVGRVEAGLAIAEGAGLEINRVVNGERD